MKNSNKIFTPVQLDSIQIICNVYGLTKCLISPNEIGCEIGEHKNLYNINIKGVCMSVNKEDNLCLFYI